MCDDDTANGGDDSSGSEHSSLTESCEADPAEFCETWGIDPDTGGPVEGGETEH